MDSANLLDPSLPQALRVVDALSDRVVPVSAEARPQPDGLSDQTVFAVFDRSGACEVFLGLVTAMQAAAHPDRILMDLLPYVSPQPLRPDTSVEAAWRRLRREGVTALAVVDDNDRFLGAVTLASLLDAALRQQQKLRHMIRRMSRCFHQRLDRLAEHSNRLRCLNADMRDLLHQAALADSVPDLLQSALTRLTELVDARYGALIIQDENGGIERFFHTGMTEEQVAAIGQPPGGKGLFGDVLCRCGTLRLRNMADHPRSAGFPEGHPPMRSLVATLIRLHGQVYGRVYLCDRRDGSAFSAEDEQLVEAFADAVGLAIDHLRERERRRRDELNLRIAAQVFESSAEGILITDAEQRIILVNRALTTITGYSKAELIGGTPKIFQSGHHGADFYRDMWQCLEESGQWQGEIWNRRKNGAVYPEWLRINALADESGRVTHYVAVFSDLSDFTRRREGMERLVHFDHLTELPNRLMFRAELKQAMLRTNFHGKMMALLMLDLDRFKTINDTLGHQIGDRLLQQVSKRLLHCVRKKEEPRFGDIVARLSGDEFTIILNGLEKAEDAAAAATKILERFQQPFVLGNLERTVTVSIGIALYPGNAETLDELISQADLAMYHAKRKGRNRFCMYDPAVHGRTQYQQVLENELYNALERGQFQIHYQPQIGVADGGAVGLEALLRWRHPLYGQVSPMEFIPMLEETGLIEPVGGWVLEQVCADYRRCVRALGMAEGELTVAVNISAHQLNEDLLERISRLLRQYRLDPGWLKLELTETVAMEDPEGSMRIFNALREIGVEICIDDFGTGYSSLSYLTRLPIAALKIDRSFIKDMIDHDEDREVVGAIIALAHNLKLQVIAEGVETREQYNTLAALGCDVVQGFLCGRPVPLEQLKPPGAPIPD